MEIKVQCDCGTKYAFDVEPVEGRMPAPVYCPSCGKDGTAASNLILEQTLGVQPTSSGHSRLRIGGLAPAAAASAQAPGPSPEGDPVPC